MKRIPMLASLLAAVAVLLLAPAALAEAPLRGGQAPGWYRMTLGRFEVTALSDGTVLAPVDRLLHNIAPERERALLARAYLKPPVETSVNGFLVNTGGKLVLIDTGAGGRLGPTLGKLLANLEASGYAPAEVDEVYLTHLHSDHAGGLVTADGKAVFSHAVVRLDAGEADYWLSPAHRDAAPADMRDVFDAAMAAMKPYVEAGRVRPYHGPAELVPGIRAVPAPGHTPGHSIFVIESDGQKLVVWGDTVHVASVQFPQPTAAWVEWDSTRAIAERLKNFADAARNGYYVALAHVDFPGIGRLRADGKGYVWVPAVYHNGGTR